MAWSKAIAIFFLWINVLSGTLALSGETITIYNTKPEFKLVVKEGKITKQYLGTYPEEANSNPLVESDGKGDDTQVVDQPNTVDNIGSIQGITKYPLKKGKRQKRDTENVGSLMTNEQCMVSKEKQQYVIYIIKGIFQFACSSRRPWEQQ